MPEPQQSMIDFAATLPADLSVDEVAEALKKGGYKTPSRAALYTLRTNAKQRREQLAKANAKAANGAPPAVPIIQTTIAPPTNGAKPSRSKAATNEAFVRSLPADMAAAEVARRAKEAGLSIDRQAVNRARWRIAQKARRARPSPTPPPVPQLDLRIHSGAPAAPLAATIPIPQRRSEWRQLFVRCACELGFAQSTDMLIELRTIAEEEALNSIPEDIED